MMFASLADLKKNKKRCAHVNKANSAHVENIVYRNTKKYKNQRERQNRPFKDYLLQ